MKVTILIDTDEYCYDSAVDCARAGEHSLADMMEIYFREKGWWDDPTFYNDGRKSMTGKQFCELGNTMFEVKVLTLLPDDDQ